MNVFESAYERRLRAKIEEKIARKGTQLTGGSGLDEFSKYREAVGEFRGLKQALELMKEVSDDLNREERLNAPDEDEA